jgi:hypothetical protein
MAKTKIPASAGNRTPVVQLDAYMKNYISHAVTNQNCASSKTLGSFGITSANEVRVELPGLSTVKLWRRHSIAGMYDHCFG